MANSTNPFLNLPYKVFKWALKSKTSVTIALLIILFLASQGSPIAFDMLLDALLRIGIVSAAIWIAWILAKHFYPQERSIRLGRIFVWRTKRFFLQNKYTLLLLYIIILIIIFLMKPELPNLLFLGIKSFLGAIVPVLLALGLVSALLMHAGKEGKQMMFGQKKKK